jgi:hypothetical protein
MTTLAYTRFGGPAAIREQLTTEQFPHLPCGEFHPGRLLRTGPASQRPADSDLRQVLIKHSGEPGREGPNEFL